MPLPHYYVTYIDPALSSPHYYVQTVEGTTNPHYYIEDAAAAPEKLPHWRVAEATGDRKPHWRVQRAMPLGAELLTNGMFTTDTVWNKGTGWTISGGTANAALGGTAASLTQAVALTAGAVYRVQFRVTSRTTGFVRPEFTGGTTVSGANTNATGLVVQYLTAVTGNTTFRLLAGANSTLQVDDASVRRVL